MKATRLSLVTIDTADTHVRTLALARVETGQNCTARWQISMTARYTAD